MLIAAALLVTLAAVIAVGSGVVKLPAPVQPLVVDASPPPPAATPLAVAPTPDVAATSPSPSITPDRPSPWIVFERSVPSDGQRYGSHSWAMRADGTGAHEILGGATAAWSPDGSRLLVNDGHIRVAEVGEDIGAFVDTGVAVPEREQWEAFDFAPDGEHVVFVRKSKCAAAPTALGLGFLAVVPDVLVAETAGANCMVLSILDLGTGTLTDLGHTLVKDQTGGRNLALELPAWSPDGTRIAYTRLDETLDTRELWLVDADGTHPARVAIPADVSVREPRWSPDGTRISFTSQTWLTESTSESVVYVVDLATGRLDRVSIASGPDDRQLCCAAWLDDTHLRVQEATGDGDRAWLISLDAAAHEPELLVDLTDALEAIDPPGRVVIRSAPGDPGRTFQWQPVAEPASGS